MKTHPNRDSPDSHLVNATARRVAFWFAGAATVFALIVFTGALWVVFSKIPPSRLIGAGEQETTLSISGVDVLQYVIILAIGAVVLAGLFALVVTRRAVAPLVDALARQRRFVADASHELRTPLTILDTRLQVLQRSMGSDSDYAGTVSALRTDSRNLVAIVNDLLETADTAPAAVPASTPVLPVVDAAIATMLVTAESRNISLTVDAGQAAHSRTTQPRSFPPETAMHDASLHRVLIALLDNAIKHTAPSGTVSVRVRTTRTGTDVSVSDQGLGIRGIEPERVFDRFARSSEAVDGGGSARTGFGIGLALVQDTVGRWGGSVEVAETSAEGTTMVVHLPPTKRRHRLSPRRLLRRDQGAERTSPPKTHAGTLHERGGDRHGDPRR